MSQLACIECGSVSRGFNGGQCQKEVERYGAKYMCGGRLSELPGDSIPIASQVAAPKRPRQTGNGVISAAEVLLIDADYLSEKGNIRLAFDAFTMTRELREQAATIMRLTEERDEARAQAKRWNEDMNAFLRDLAGLQQGHAKRVKELRTEIDFLTNELRRHDPRLVSARDRNRGK